MQTLDIIPMNSIAGNNKEFKCIFSPDFQDDPVEFSEDSPLTELKKNDWFLGYKHTGTFLTITSQKIDEIQGEKISDSSQEYILARGSAGDWELYWYEDHGGKKTFKPFLLNEDNKKELKSLLAGKEESTIEIDQIKRIVENEIYDSKQKDFAGDIERYWKVTKKLTEKDDAKNGCALKKYIPFHHQSLGGIAKTCINRTVSEAGFLVLSEDYTANVEVEDESVFVTTENSIFMVGKPYKNNLFSIPGHSQIEFELVEEHNEDGSIRQGVKLKAIRTSSPVLLDFLLGKIEFSDNKKENEKILKNLILEAKQKETPDSLYQWYKEQIKFVSTMEQKNICSEVTCRRYRQNFYAEFVSFLHRHEKLAKKFKEEFTAKEAKERLEFAKILVETAQGRIALQVFLGTSATFLPAKNKNKSIINDDELAAYLLKSKFLSQEEYTSLALASMSSFNESNSGVSSKLPSSVYINIQDGLSTAHIPEPEIFSPLTRNEEYSQLLNDPEGEIKKFVEAFGKRERDGSNRLLPQNEESKKTSSSEDKQKILPDNSFSSQESFEEVLHEHNNNMNEASLLTIFFEGAQKLALSFISKLSKLQEIIGIFGKPKDGVDIQQHHNHATIQ